MSVHYHGTPITPYEALYSLRGGHFCVSHAAPGQVEAVHQLAQGVMLDNGAFTKWKAGKATDWPAYYSWCDRWLDHPNTWAIIPDVIDGGSQIQDALVQEWPHGSRGAPVWHMDEPLNRLLRLIDEWPRVCIGSTQEYATVGSPLWHERMTDLWNEIESRHKRTPAVHMLRGMQCSGWIYPFASVDSSDVAQNHHRPQNEVREMMDRWNAIQCPGTWRRRKRAQQIGLALV